MRKIRSALISLSDKSNLKPLLKELRRNNIKIISSGGTFKAIKKLDLNVQTFQILQALKKYLTEESKLYTQKYMQEF